MCPMLHAQTHGLLSLTFLPLSVCLSAFDKYILLRLVHVESVNVHLSCVSVWLLFPPKYSNAMFRMQRDNTREMTL